MTAEDGWLLDMQGVTVRVGDRIILPDTSWRIRRGEQWAVLGPNGSGKSSLARLISADLHAIGGTVRRGFPIRGKGGVGYISFELHNYLIGRDLWLDHARFVSGVVERLTTAREILLETAPNTEDDVLDHVCGLFEIGPLLERPIRHLSTGEIRKVLIARALLKEPALLILDEPFDGLDVSSRHRLEQILTRLVREGIHLILVTHRQEEILPSISHVLCIKDGHVTHQGRREEILEPAILAFLYGPPTKVEKNRAAAGPTAIVGGALIELRNVSVRYGDIRVLEDVTWTMRRGESWAIVGPNGAGKTTLLSLIAADHLQAYSNDVRLFGRRRGSGDSIWEIKQRIGIVTPHLQVAYQKSMTAGEAVLSGFFDSIGLYRLASSSQQRIAEQWIDRLDVRALAERRFDRLSYGERRLVLIARAMVKSPEILILDEPTQGLDPRYRARALDLIDRIGLETSTDILYVTHHQDEIPHCVSKILRIEDGKVRSSGPRLPGPPLPGSPLP